jgi:hypothetical protein
MVFLNIERTITMKTATPSPAGQKTTVSKENLAKLIAKIKKA